MIVCWGAGADGQLGIGAFHVADISEPLDISTFRDRAVQTITCGLNHTIVCTAAGRLYTFGRNTLGQLGQQKGQMRPEVVEQLELHTIVNISAGDNFTIAVNESGNLFSWGENNYGQLGLGTKTSETIPRYMLGLAGKKIVEVACGASHTLALTYESSLYSWGSNSHGQLGVGLNPTSSSTPMIVSSTIGLPISRIAAGGNHSFILLNSGALFAFGSNAFGQLGVGDEVDRNTPTQCTALDTQYVSYAACGEDHSALLTYSGGLYTFGAGSCGQLGHGSCEHEQRPRKVADLSNWVVTQVACGRRHTLCYVQDTATIYSFGLGASGQLGNGSKSNTIIPTKVNSNLIDSQKDKYVHAVYSGGDQSFVVLVDSNGSNKQLISLDFRDNNLPTLAFSDPILNMLVSVTESSILTEEAAIPLEAACRSLSAYNASFYPRHTNTKLCSSNNPDIDYITLRRVFNNLENSMNSKVDRLMSKCLSQLIGFLPCELQCKGAIEVLRVFLILPNFQMFDNPKYMFDVTVPFASKLLSLSPECLTQIKIWWLNISVTAFARFISIYKLTISELMYISSGTSADVVRSRREGVSRSLQVLALLYKVNCSAKSEIVPCQKFYIPEIMKRIPLHRDYILWLQQGGNVSLEGVSTGLVPFCNFPFVFSADAKSQLVKLDAKIQMQFAIDEVQQHNFMSLFTQNQVLAVPFLVMLIDRNNIVSSALSQLIKLKNDKDFKKPLKIVFLGEDGVDEGGATKEFFLLIMKELTSTKYGMFRSYPETHTIWFNERSFEDESMYFLIGALCGLAIYNFTIIDLPFPLALYKKLLSCPVGLDDMADLSPTVFNSLTSILEYENDDLEDVFMMSFEYRGESYGSMFTVELKPDGSSIPVTIDTKESYVSLYVDYMLNGSCERLFAEFSSGFHKVCSLKVMSLLHPKELMALVVGNENYDFSELESTTEYKGEFRDEHKTIRYFWDVVNEFADDEKKIFLKWLTGTDRIPICGMKDLRLVIQPVYGGELFLPVAHTCFNLLDLPVYSSKDQLRNKLTRAMQEHEGFHLA